MKILIIINDPGTLNAPRANLTSAGYEVDTVTEGQQTLNLIKTSSKFWRFFNLLAADLKVPDLKDIESIRKAKSAIPLLVCILMTAFGSRQARKALSQMQNCIYLEKPFTPDGLRN